MITREADYAMRVVLFLAGLPKGESVSTTALSEEMNIPYRFLRRIVRKLCSAGLVGSLRGKAGGVYLRKRPKRISAYEVLGIFDPKSLLLNRCHGGDNICTRRNKCSVHKAFIPLQHMLGKHLQSIDFEKLAGT